MTSMYSSLPSGPSLSHSHQ